MLDSKLEPLSSISGIRVRRGPERSDGRGRRGRRQRRADVRHTSRSVCEPHDHSFCIEFFVPRKFRFSGENRQMFGKSECNLAISRTSSSKIGENLSTKLPTQKFTKIAAKVLGKGNVFYLSWKYMKKDDNLLKI